MAIVQISKIQQRSGNLVDLPQLDEAELGFASDEKLLFIGKEEPPENIEVLTSYSNIAFTQLEGAVGNLDINEATVSNGQVLTYDGNNWVNRGGNVGGLITLGDVSNVKLDGGAIDYVLTTDGTGNIYWSAKSTIIAYILNVENIGNLATVTTVVDNFLTQGAEITITNPVGMTELAGQTYYADIQTSNSFVLYDDPILTIPADISTFSPYAYSTATNTFTTFNKVKLDNANVFAINDPIQFIGNTFGGIAANTQYYILSVDAPNGNITISDTVGGNVLPLSTANGNCVIYGSGGRIASLAGGATGTAAEGANGSIQFNNNNLLDGETDLTWNYLTNQLNVNGNVNTNNVVVNTAVYTTAITTGDANTSGSLTGNWVLTSGSRLQATYADLAEYYAADAAYIPGTVLEFGGEKEVTVAGIETNKLAGVVSSEPAYVMNGNIEAAHPVMIALIGRVPVRVTGHVSKGDMLVSAGNGLAKASILTPKIGTVIGKAISNKWEDGEGVVEVMVGRM